MNSKPEYEFGGPLGAAGIISGLPVILYGFAFVCNDVSGCPAPSLLDPTTFTWDKFKSEIGWPREGLRGLGSWEATWVVLGYYFLSLVLYRLLPAQEVYGTKLSQNGKPLKYRLNAFSSTVVHLAICAVGTYAHGANFIVWTYIADNYVQLLTAFTIFGYALSIFVYVRSFTVDTKYPNRDLRELAAGGDTGNLIYDFYIGRELNPRVVLPFFGEVDIKAWFEMRPGLTGWILLNLAFVAKQYRNYGYLSDSIVFVTIIQGYYVLDGQYFESGLLRMMDITTDGLGFMLAFGDTPWVPFIYSAQTRYLSVYPLQLGVANLAAVCTIFATGLFIFRASNRQKLVFRTRPDDPSVKDLSYIQTKRGTRLLVDGWWALSRHFNYFGDWLQSLPFSLPTGVSGYLIVPAAGATASGTTYIMLDGRVIVQGAARGWGIIFTYFYVLYFTTLLVHRERRDDAMCLKKYGDDWVKYRNMVRWRIIPWVY